MKLKELRTYLGAALLIAGSILFLAQGRVLATFILDTMVMTIGLEGQGPTSHEFSWGELVFNTSLQQIQWSAISFAMMLFGIFLMVPTVKSLSADGDKWRNVLLTVLGISLLLAAFGTWLLAQRIKQEMIWMKESGAPDPDSFGESMPVTVWNYARAALCVGALALSALAAYGMRKPVKEGEPRSMALPFVYVFAGLYCVVLMAATAGPAKNLCQMAQPGQAADPAKFASHIASSIQSIQMASLVLLASTIFAWVAVFSKTPKLDSAKD